MVFPPCCFPLGPVTLQSFYFLWKVTCFSSTLPPSEMQKWRVIFSCNLISVIWSSEQWKVDEVERPEARKRSNGAILWKCCLTHANNRALICNGLKAVETSSGENVNVSWTPHHLFKSVNKGPAFRQILAFLPRFPHRVDHFFRSAFWWTEGKFEQIADVVLWNFDANVDPLW